MNRMKKSGDPGLAERDREREREAGVTGHSQIGAPRHMSAQNAAATSSTTPAANDGVRGTTGVLLRHQSFFGSQIIILFEKKKSSQYGGLTQKKNILCSCLCHKCPPSKILFSRIIGRMQQNTMVGSA